MASSNEDDTGTSVTRDATHGAQSSTEQSGRSRVVLKSRSRSRVPLPGRPQPGRTADDVLRLHADAMYKLAATIHKFDHTTQVLARSLDNSTTVSKQLSKDSVANTEQCNTMVHSFDRARDEMRGVRKTNDSIIESLGRYVTNLKNTTTVISTAEGAIKTNTQRCNELLAKMDTMMARERLQRTIDVHQANQASSSNIDKSTGGKHRRDRKDTSRDASRDRKKRRRS